MKVLIDTNVMISAFSFRSANLRSMIQSVLAQGQLIMTSYIADELLRVTQEKSPQNVPETLSFLRNENLRWFTLPEDHVSTMLIDDPKDQPILDAAILHNVDVIVSGDHHFLALDLESPRVMQAADFIAEFLPELK